MTFAGTVSIVTGGAGGLGAAVVRRIHADGGKVVIADLADDKAEKLAAELGEEVQYSRTDVTDEDSVSATIAAAAELGTLRYGVIAHGGWGVAERIVGRDGSPATLSGFTKTLDLYLTGTYNVLRLVAARVATTEPLDNGERGALVSTASIAGYEGQIGQTAYAAAKAGVIGLTIAAARDLSSVKIRANTIAPGTMRTPIMESVGEDALAKFTANIPFPKRLGEPHEFADTAAFLLTNGYVNGETIRLDGAPALRSPLTARDHTPMTDEADSGAVPVSDLSAVTQDYLKVIWTAQEWSDTDVTTKLLADKLEVSASTVSESVRKLADQGLVSHERYGAVTLTDAGRSAAVLMVRRHRLIETFLFRELGYGWDEVHDEAEVLEHAVSDRLMDCLDAKLGRPIRDPHGDAIPDIDGKVPESTARLLAVLTAGDGGRVARIADTDPDMLRYFDTVGVAPDRVIEVVETRPFAGTVAVTIDGQDPVDLGDLAARAIWVDAE